MIRSLFIKIDSDDPGGSLSQEEAPGLWELTRKVAQSVETRNPDLEEEIEKSLNRETSEDDTHPSPRDRFRFTRRIVLATEEPVSGLVWDLFRDREALTREMTSQIQSELQTAW